MDCLSEDALEARVNGRVTAEELVEQDRHVAQCPSCRRVLAMLARMSNSGASSTPPPSGPTTESDRGDGLGDADESRRFGRYQLVRELGRGGMGVVHEAIDPELDRRVAIKRLHPSIAAVTGPRLLREARALARLSHPNVVNVFELGSVGDEIYIAMELVEGTTMRVWLAQRERSADEILEAYGAAGRGLAAAHLAGLVHRDFKPDNVLVASDGRIKVVDFGLVHADTLPDLPSSGPISLEPDEGSLTRTGSWLGTPHYMAPEQLRGEATDARTDQFGLCVALWAALAGRRPFAGDSLIPLRENVLAGRLDPAASKIPRSLRLVLERGLAVSPDARWPTVDALLAALERASPRRRRRKRTVWAAGVGTLGIATGLAMANPLAEDACASPRYQLDDVWSEAIADELFASAAGPMQASATSTRGYLSSWAGAWTEVAADTCRSQRVRGVSVALFDRRLRCLDRARTGFETIVGFLREPDGLADAAQAVERLPPASACASAEPPGAGPLIEGAQAREQYARLDRARILAAAGRLHEAQALAEAVIEHRLPAPSSALLAEASLQVGQIELEHRDYRAARSSLTTAVVETIRSGDDHQHAHAMIGLGEAMIKLNEHASARLLIRQAEARLATTTEPSPWRVHLSLLRTNLSLIDGSIEDALAHSREANDWATQLDYAPLAVATTWVGLGEILAMQGDREQAASFYDRAFETYVARLGPWHPRTLMARLSQGELARDRGQLDEAEAIARAVIEHAKADSVDAAGGWSLLASVQSDRNDDEQAQRSLGEAIDTMARTPEGSQFRMVEYRNSLAVMLMRSGDYEQGIDEIRRVIRTREAMLGPEHPLVGSALYNLAAALAETGQHDESMEAMERVEVIERLSLPADHPNHAYRLHEMGRIAKRMGKLELAEDRFARAVALYEGRGKAVHTRKFRMSLGEVILDQVDAGAPRRDEAVAVVRRALAEFDDGPPPHPSDACRVHRATARVQWLEGDAAAAVAEARRALALADALPEPTRAQTQAEIREWLRAHPVPPG